MGRPRRAAESDPSATAASHHQPASPLSPGVLILSATREPIYITPSAHRFLAELDGAMHAAWVGPALPRAIHHVCDELQQHGPHDQTALELDTVQARQLAKTAQATILVRGYAIREQRNGQTGRFLILLETAPPDSPATRPPSEADHRFTERQRAILNGLMLGHTNKEIADNLQISVHTVKEYIRQIMMKLQTTSRTGIVARVAGLTLSTAKASDQRNGPGSRANIQVA